MAKEPEDKSGASSADGNEPSPESNPPKEEPTSSAEPGAEQEELPLGDSSTEPESPAAASDETEPPHDDQDSDATQDFHGDDHGEEYHHDDEHQEGDYHHDYHDEYHHDEHHQGHNDPDGSGSHGGYGGYDFDEGDEEAEEGEVFGGPVKPFLDHLEDFRWVIMKCVVAVVLGMLIALIGSPYIIDFLKIPLEKAQKSLDQSQDPEKRSIPVKFGDGMVFSVKEADLARMMGTNRVEGGVTNLADVKKISLIPANPRLDGNSTRLDLNMRLDGNSTVSDKKWEVQLKAYGPLKSFFIALKIGLYGGLTISMPFLIFFAGQFILPALRVNEKQWLFKLSSFGTVLFFTGVMFAFLVVMQVALWASVGFAGALGLGADEWQAEEYISFVCKFTLGMGIAFQMPMVILFLVKIGLLDYEKLSKFRMYAVVANLILAAVITPTGDPFTLCLVAVPLQLLYELSTLIAWIWFRREAEEEAAEEED